MIIYRMQENKEAAGSSGGRTDSRNIGLQLMDYIRHRREEGRAGESKEAYAARVCAKAQAGKKLTAEEMSFLARTNPELYRKALRAQSMRRALESRLRSCRSRQEAQEAFFQAMESVSEKDPDRDTIRSALMDAFKEFQNSVEYAGLPETTEEDEKGKGGKKDKEKDRDGDIETEKGTLTVLLNSDGYQETWLMEDSACPVSFRA